MNETLAKLLISFAILVLGSLVYAFLRYRLGWPWIGVFAGGGLMLLLRYLAAKLTPQFNW